MAHHTRTLLCKNRHGIGFVLDTKKHRNWKELFREWEARQRALHAELFPECNAPLEREDSVSP